MTTCGIRCSAAPAIPVAHAAAVPYSADTAAAAVATHPHPRPCPGPSFRCRCFLSSMNCTLHIFTSKDI